MFFGKKKIFLLLFGLAGAVILVLIIFFVLRRIVPGLKTPSPSPSAGPSPDVLPAATESGTLGEGTRGAQQSTSSAVQSSPASSVSSVSLSDCETTSGSLSFEVETISATSEFAFTYIQPSGSVISSVDIDIPSGWDIAPSVSIAEGLVLGTGCFKSTIGGNSFTSLVTVVNSQDTQGNRARWNFVFGNVNSPDVVIDTFIDGNPGQGYKWKINRKFLFDIQPPLNFHIKVAGDYIKETGGNGIFRSLSRFVNGLQEALERVRKIL